MDVVFEVDAELLPAVADGFQMAAQVLLIELIRARKAGPWIDDLRARIRYQAATLEAPNEADGETCEKWAPAAVAAVDHVFDSVRLQGKPNRR